MSDWPSSAEIDAMPLDILSGWFWQPIPAVTADQQSLVRRAAERLHQPPAVAPVYRFIEPAEAATPEPEKTAPKPVKKAKAPPAIKAEPKPKPEAEPEQSSLDIFKSLFR